MMFRYSLKDDYEIYKDNFQYIYWAKGKSWTYIHSTQRANAKNSQTITGSDDFKTLKGIRNILLESDLNDTLVGCFFEIKKLEKLKSPQPTSINNDESFLLGIESFRKSKSLLGRLRAIRRELPHE